MDSEGRGSRYVHPLRDLAVKEKKAQRASGLQQKARCFFPPSKCRSHLFQFINEVFPDGFSVALVILPVPGAAHHGIKRRLDPAYSGGRSCRPARIPILNDVPPARPARKAKGPVACSLGTLDRTGLPHYVRVERHFSDGLALRRSDGKACSEKATRGYRLSRSSVGSRPAFFSLNRA